MKTWDALRGRVRVIDDGEEYWYPWHLIDGHRLRKVGGNVLVCIDCGENRYQL